MIIGFLRPLIAAGQRIKRKEVNATIGDQSIVYKKNGTLVSSASSSAGEDTNNFGTTNNSGKSSKVTPAQDEAFRKAYEAGDEKAAREKGIVYTDVLDKPFDVLAIPRHTF